MLAKSTAGLLGAILFTGAASSARSQEVRKELQDRFLDNLAGQWHVSRKFGSGRTAEGTVSAGWAFKHHFIELRYGEGDASPDYEAYVFIGFDEADHQYVCHRVDVFGAHYSLMGHGRISENLLSLDFRFDAKDGGVTNRFTFDPPTNTWTSLIRQQEKGEWKTFVEEKWTRIAPKS